MVLSFNKCYVSATVTIAVIKRYIPVRVKKIILPYFRASVNLLQFD